MSIKSTFAKPLRAEILPLLMAILALITVEVAQSNGDLPSWQIAIKVAIVAIVIIAVYRQLSRCGHAGFQPGRMASPLLIGLTILPLPLEVVQNFLWKTGNPLEFLLLAGFRNLACGLAVLSYLPAFHRICSVISLFLVIFASCITSDLIVHGLVVVYALIGVWWLMGVYWDSLQGHLTGSVVQRQFPRRFVLAIPVIFLALLCFAPLVIPQVASALPGFMPTSGGDQWSDPNARRGLNDGEALVPATDQARSFGPVETEVFMESDQPSLYDVFNDVYGEPPKKNRLQDRSVALPPELMQESHERMAQQKKLGRQFSTVRSTRSESQKKLKDVEGTALFYVGGRVPLHLRLQTYDLFDGVEWYPEALATRTSGLKMEVIGPQPWVHVDSFDNQHIYRRGEPHQLKIINLNTNCIPAPLGLTGVHIDRVDRIDMFGWAQDSIVKMNRDKLPDLTVIHLQSRAANTTPLQNEPFSNTTKRLQYSLLPEQSRTKEIQALLREWIGQHPDGWPRVEAILSQLRTHYLLDRDYRPAADCDDTVAEFLFESKRGNDYLFASAAAILLRNLGYNTRVVSGFYADPKKFDSKLAHTPITENDVHFWAEVYVGTNTWVTAEATPGYEVLAPRLGFWESFGQGCSTFLKHFQHHSVGYCALLVAVLAALWRRHELNDWTSTLLWHARSRSQPRRHVLRTVALLRQRARWAGIPHPEAMTSSRWLRELSVMPAQGDQHLMQRFSYLTEWAAYAPQDSEQLLENNVTLLCLMVAKEWTLVRMRSLTSSPSAVSHRLEKYSHHAHSDTCPADKIFRSESRGTDPSAVESSPAGQN